MGIDMRPTFTEDQGILRQPTPIIKWKLASTVEANAYPGINHNGYIYILKQVYQSKEDGSIEYIPIEGE